MSVIGELLYEDSGHDHGLGREVALVQADRGVEQPVERIVLLLDEQVVRHLARREQLERAREAVVVVDERAGDDELVQQDAVRVELRPRHARADEHERARALQLRERRLLGAAVARALERDVERLVDDVVRPSAASTSSSGATVRAPSFSHSAAARSLRLADDDVVDAERLERGDLQEPDRTAAGHEPARSRAGRRRPA